MIKTKKGKTVIKGNILEDVSDLTAIMISLKEKHSEDFLVATSKSILKMIHNKTKEDKIEKILNML